MYFHVFSTESQLLHKHIQQGESVDSSGCTGNSAIMVIRGELAASSSTGSAGWSP
jgi:hypothetical protein